MACNFYSLKKKLDFDQFIAAQNGKNMCKIQLFIMTTENLADCFLFVSRLLPPSRPENHLISSSMPLQKGRAKKPYPRVKKATLVMPNPLLIVTEEKAKPAKAEIHAASVVMAEAMMKEKEEIASMVAAEEENAQIGRSNTNSDI